MSIARRLGLAESETEELIRKKICIVSDRLETHQYAASATANMLARTFDEVSVGNLDPSSDLVIAIGNIQVPDNLNVCRASFFSDCVSFKKTNAKTANGSGKGLHGSLVLLGSCFLCANVTRSLIPALAEGPAAIEEVFWEDAFPGVTKALKKPLILSEAYLVGAGAIGNGFAWALSTLDVSGALTVIDDDDISDGNLNRNALHYPEQVGSSKALFLASYLREHCSQLAVKGVATSFEDYARKLGSSLRVNTMISAVDSRRMRRILQAYLPFQVYDASTGGLGDIVFHHNRVPLTEACLACVYAELPDEQSHDKHIAELLGVSVDDVRKGRISQEAAKSIASRHPSIKPEDIEGASFHSLFKQLCGAGMLQAARNDVMEVALAPLCFVSVLAGVILLLELAVGTNAPERHYNMARFSPWNAPRKKNRSIYPKNARCDFCSNPTLLNAHEHLWLDYLELM